MAPAGPAGCTTYLEYFNLKDPDIAAFGELDEVRMIAGPASQDRSES